MKIFGLNPWFFVFVLVCFDQALKNFIKSNFYLGEQLEVFDWFSFYFVENNGFAFGYEFFGEWGKLLLTTIRIVFVIIIFKWIVDFINLDQNRFVLLAFLLIFSGAIGNIIDSVFYGVFYGYAPLFFGRVVDMFYFPLFSGTYPEWLPFVGGNDFIFLSIFSISPTPILLAEQLFYLFFTNRFHLNNALILPLLSSCFFIFAKLE